MKKTALVPLLLLVNTGLFGKDISGEALVSIPAFNPDSDAFFAAEFQKYSSQTPHFFYADILGELIYIPDGAKAVPSSYTSDALARGVASIGAMIPLGNYVSGIASFSLVLDNPYIAQSINLFTGGGLFGHYNFLGLGLFAGYYRDHYQELPKLNNASGVYSGILDDQPAVITNAARFLVIPRIGLSGKVFFLDEIGALFNFSEKFDLTNVLGKLAFATLELGAIRLGIDLYYTQSNYNLLLEQKSLGARFEAKNLSVEAGYRWFLDTSVSAFLSNYQNGAYGRIIVKFPFQGVNVLVSYSFERTFELMHYLGLGISLPLADWTNDFFYEFGANSFQNMRFSGANFTSLGP
jgi:hypothetical protein